MAYIPGVAETNITEFGGSTQRLGEYGTPINKALYSQNCGYSPGQVSKRLGHSAEYTVTGGCTSLHNWLFYFDGTPVINVLHYTSSVGLGGQQIDPPLGPLSTLIPVTGAAGASVVPVNQRAYAAFYDATGQIGASAAYVYGWDIGSDPLFAAPVAATIIAGENAAGVVTAGLHRIAYLPTTRNGFTTKLSPVIAGTFTPTEFTSTGGQNLTIQINGTPPAYMSGGSYQMVMTPVTNLNRWYTVPGVYGLAANGLILTASIDDDDLVATGTDVTDQINLLTCSETTAPYGPPFLPSAIFPYSNRMGYCTLDASGVPVVYMSNQNDYQSLAADLNGLYLEGADKPVQGVSIGGVCYIGTPSAFYSCTDSGDSPVNWTPPQKVQGSVGILSPTCLSVDPSQTRALVAAQQGLFLFPGGEFPQLPLSYYQGTTDWARIDWTTPTKVQVIEDQSNKRFVVIAPLTADENAAAAIAAAATYEMSWDYTQGVTPDTVKYSINPYTSYSIGCTTMVLNPDKYVYEQWTGPASTGKVISQNDGSEANPYADVDLAGSNVSIPWLYRTSIVPGEDANQATVHDFHGAHFRVTGEGTLDIAAYGIDATGSVNISVTPPRSPLTLSLTPGEEPLVKWYLRSEQQSIEFGNDVVDEYATVNLLRVYWTNAMGFR
jgi:hypothetical protein